MRIYRDATEIPNTDLWFEISPDRFICASDIREAMAYGDFPAAGLTLDEIRDTYGLVGLVSTDPNYTDPEDNDGEDD